jgi:hypothetical protein
MRPTIMFAVLLILEGCTSPEKPVSMALPKTATLQMHAADEEINGQCYIQDNYVRFEFSKPVDVVLKCHADCQVVTVSGPQSVGISDFQLLPGWSHGSAEPTYPPALPVGVQGGTATCLSL